MFRLLTVKGLLAKAEVFCWVVNGAIASASIFLLCKAIKQFL